MGESESGNLGWKAALTPDLQNHERLTPIKEVKDLASGYVDLATKYDEAGKKIGDYEGKLKDALFIPGESATDEEKAAFYAKLGRPETPDKYEIGKPTDWPADLPFDENMVKGFKDVAHKLGIPAAAAKNLFAWYNGLYAESMKADLDRRQKELTEGQKTMQTEWKDKYEENSKITAKAVEVFGGEEFKKFLDESNLGNHPAFVRAFFNIGRAMIEDKFISGSPGGGDKKTSATGNLHYESMQKK